MVSPAIRRSSPPDRYIRYGPSETVPLAQSVPLSAVVGSQTAVDQWVARPGDFILTHSSGLVGSMIRFAERLSYWGKNAQYAHWSHAAIFVDNEGHIIEAVGGGVQKRHISVYAETEYVVVYLPPETSDADRDQAAKFAEHAVRQPYGWLTIVGIVFSLLTASKMSFGIDGQQICSALVARCLERTGTIFTEGEPWHLMPADLAKHFKVEVSKTKKGKVPRTTTGVVAYSKPGRRRRS